MAAQTKKYFVKHNYRFNLDSYVDSCDEHD